MKVALFTDAYLPDINGVVSSVVILQKELEKHGHTVYIVTTHPKLLETSIENNIVRLPGIELKQLYGYVMTSPLHSSTAEIIGGWGLDVIHAHTEFGVGIFARLVAKKYKIPLVSTYHTTYEDYTHYVNIINSKTLDKIAKKTVASLSKLYGESSVEVIAPSQKTKDMLIRYGINRKISVVPTGLDLKKFKKVSDSVEAKRIRTEEYQATENQTIITYIGRIAKEKSIDLIVEAFSYIKKAKENCKLIIIGGGPDLEGLKEQAERLGISDYVSFLGKKPLNEIPNYYHAADAFVSASLTETQGVTFIEALASGLPVFARPDEVLDELVYENKTGYYFKNSEELAEKLIQFHHSSKEKRDDLAKHAVETVKVYDSEIFYEKIMEVYESAVLTYHKMYEITHVRYKQDAVEIKVENSLENKKILISVETFANEGLRRDGKISEELVQKLEEEQAVVLAYQKAIRRLTTKDRTRKEMYDWLTQETELSIQQINSIIEQLEEKGFIDDRRFVYSQIVTLKSMLQGKQKIERDLVKRGIPIELIEEAFEHEEDQDQLNLAIRYAEKIQPTIKDHSMKYKKQTMKQKMLQQGFSMDVIDEAMSCISFVSDEMEELEHLRKQAVKARNRYQRKYSGSELRNRTYRFLVAQGYKVDDIYCILNEMEWENERDDD